MPEGIEALPPPLAPPDGIEGMEDPLEPLEPPEGIEALLEPLEPPEEGIEGPLEPLEPLELLEEGMEELLDGIEGICGMLDWVCCVVSQALRINAAAASVVNVLITVLSIFYNSSHVRQLDVRVSSGTTNK
ncbi:MAG: hypothetical protein CMQ46_10250 [Gammaproteobacteria bacterium]|nr:hypothetical protein [Gammaproteobacteria bacterium]MBJ55629.1 hypothetical protein [Gammaproteobacteria bacterium]HBN16031.1 hypothetical protein [Pseudohongiella sp.]